MKWCTLTIKIVSEGISAGYADKAFAPDTGQIKFSTFCQAKVDMVFYRARKTSLPRHLCEKKDILKSSIVNLIAYIVRLCHLLNNTSFSFIHQA